MLLSGCPTVSPVIPVSLPPFSTALCCLLSSEPLVSVHRQLSVLVHGLVHAQSLRIKSAPSISVKGFLPSTQLCSTVMAMTVRARYLSLCLCFLLSLSLSLEGRFFLQVSTFLLKWQLKRDPPFELLHYNSCLIQLNTFKQPQDIIVFLLHAKCCMGKTKQYYKFTNLFSNGHNL